MAPFGVCEGCRREHGGPGRLCPSCRRAEDGPYDDVDDAYELADASGAGPFG
jgi:hypothetical protein